VRADILVLGDRDVRCRRGGDDRPLGFGSRSRKAKVLILAAGVCCRVTTKRRLGPTVLAA